MLPVLPNKFRGRRMKRASAAHFKTHVSSSLRASAAATVNDNDDDDDALMLPCWTARSVGLPILAAVQGVR